MNRKILAISIIGVLATVVVLLIASLVLAGKNSRNESDFVLEDSSDNYVSACKAVVGEAVMVMNKDGYQPKEIKIKLCTKVVFKNAAAEPLWPASDIHPTHGIYPQFDPREPVEAGREWSFVFDKVGRWKYHDHLNPTIRGVIEVSE